MRCKTCDYSLWNLKTRACPECGAPFLPTDYEFVANSVAFCCPHCDQAYYGTGAAGYLEPPEFDCISCGKHVEMDAMVLRPTEGVKEENTRLGVMPWFEREERGRVKAWLATVWMSMVQPGVLMRGVSESSPAGAAWWYAIITNMILIVGRFLPALCIMIPFMLLAAPAAGPGTTGTPGIPGWGMLAGGAAAGGVLGLASSVFFVALGLGLWGLVIHGFLRLGGPVAGGLGRTYQAICYSSGASAICIVPCINDLGLIWWVVSAVLMVREGQRVSGLRASLAVLSLPIAVVVLVIGIYAALVGTLIASSSASAVNAQTTAVLQVEAIAIAARIEVYRSEHDGAWPVHGLELVPTGGGGTGVLISAVSETAPENVPVGSGTLKDFQSLGSNRQSAEAERAAAALPADVVAHRVGDVVFTWHGVEPSTADPGLWLYVVSPIGDPGAADPACCACAGRMDGSVDVLEPATMVPLLEEQNLLRAAHGLPPVPDLATITHESPAVAR